jgi:HD-like signal output (HDOD) protein/CheY-like chemotaxis protein
MRRVLFVDDDPAVLQSLRTALQQLRPEWQLVFVDSAATALAELALRPFDALISDIGMAAMDGAKLLATVREQHPNVMRLCLSGSMDDEAFARAMPVTHQFLAKPCDPEELCEIVERACSLRTIPQNDAIRELIGKLKWLPTTPKNFEALSSAISEPNAHTHEITQVVSKDSALCIKVLQIVNSALFRRSGPITSIQAAITLVGLEMIKSLALSACVFNALDASRGAHKLLQDLQARSIRKAHFAHMLMHDSHHAEEAFTAALLLDIGEAVLAMAAPEKFERMLTLARNSHRQWHEVEPEIFGVAHPEVGAYLLGLWGLPLELIEAVAHHHKPSLVRHAQTRVLAAVHVADAVIDATADQAIRLLDRLDATFVERTEVVRCLQAWKIDTESDAQRLALP